MLATMPPIPKPDRPLQPVLTIRLAAAAMLLAWFLPSAASAAIVATVTYPDNTAVSAKLVCTDDVTRRQVPCSDYLQSQNLGGDQVEQAWSSRDFPSLDKLYDNWCKSEERFPDGGWKISTYLPRLATVHTAWQTWDEDLQIIRSWQKERRSSIAARMVEVSYWESYAWHARGSSYARDVTPAAWKLFKERLARADAAADQIKPLAASCPVWYETKIRIALARQDLPAARAAFDEGSARFPQYHRIYFAMARAYEPKWGGSLMQFERFADEAVTRAKGFEGSAMYARVFWTVDQPHDVPFDPAKRVPDWRKLKKAYDDLLKAYPNSEINLNRYAAVACQSKDTALYRRLRGQIDSKLIPEMFKTVPLAACDRRHGWQGTARAK